MHPTHDRRATLGANPASSASDRDAGLRRAIELRRVQQLAQLTEPEFPASGTELISARLAEARARQRLTRTVAPVKPG